MVAVSSGCCGVFALHVHFGPSLNPSDSSWVTGWPGLSIEQGAFAYCETSTGSAISGASLLGLDGGPDMVMVCGFPHALSTTRQATMPSPNRDIPRTPSG